MKMLLATLLFSFGFFSQASAQSEFSLALLPITSTANSVGVMTVILVDQKTVQSTLPSGLNMIPRLMTPDGKYPVAMFIGQHNDLTAHFGDHDVVVEKSYHEATFTLSVWGPKTETEYSYTSKIVVDSVPALLMGRALGYPKVLVDVKSDANGFSASSLLQGSFVKTTYTNDVGFDTTEFLNNLQFLSGQMRPTISKIGEVFLCFNLDWDMAKAQVQPVSVNVSLSDAFLGDGLGVNLQSPSLARSPFGSFRIQSDWVMHSFRLCEQ